MSEKIIDNSQKIFIAFLDEDNKLITGYFKLLELRENWVFLKTLSGENTLIIPTHRVLKIKKGGEKN